MLKFFKKLFVKHKVPDSRDTLSNCLVAHIDKAGRGPTAPNKLR